MSWKEADEITAFVGIQLQKIQNEKIEPPAGGMKHQLEDIGGKCSRYKIDFQRINAIVQEQQKMQKFLREVKRPGNMPSLPESVEKILKEQQSNADLAAKRRQEIIAMRQEEKEKCQKLRSKLQKKLDRAKKRAQLKGL